MITKFGTYKDIKINKDDIGTIDEVKNSIDSYFAEIEAKKYNL